MREYNESQKKVLSSGGNVLVSASAGSGKTTVMIEKIYLLLQSGKDIGRMAVMTFSKASAAEMKNRLVKKLYEAVRRGGEEGRIAQKQLSRFPFSNINTIDGFCYGLIKKYYAVIGVDPSATPLDPDESDRLWDESVDKAIEQRLADGDRNTIRFLERYSSARRLDSAKMLIGKMMGFLAVQPDKERFFTEDFSEKRRQFLEEEFKKRFFAVINDGKILLADLLCAGMDKHATQILGINERIERLLEKNGEEFFNEIIYFPDILAVKKTKGVDEERHDRYKAWLNDEVRNVVDKARSFLTAEGRAGEDEGEKELVRLTFAAESIYAARKKRDGKLDFNDLNRIALEILRDEETAKQIRESFDYIFVDEYQDTNYLQEKLIEGISDGNNVFVVGDIKQAIYHFRYAEPEIFNARKNRYAKGEGTNIYLNENYRSKKEILSFVNAVCSEIMTPEFCDVDYKQNPMIAGADYGEETGGVEVYFYDSEKVADTCKGVYSVRDASTEEEYDPEGNFVARYIKNMVGKETIYSPKTGKSRPVGYGDIAVLTRKSASGLKIASALADLDIPYAINDSEEGEYYPRELLVAFLRLCIDEDDVSIVSTMSCPLFNFSPTELMDIVDREEKVPFWVSIHRYNGNDIIKTKINKYLEYIEELRRRSSAATATELMIKVLSDGLDGYFDELDGEAGGRIRRFLAAASELDSNNDISDFLLYYDESYKGERPPVGVDGVAIMTMHKSKGLEFPIVFLPYCDEVSKGGGQERFFADKDLGIALQPVDEEAGLSYDTFATRILRFKKEVEEREELSRLMYVDFTRAENKLIISGKRPKNKFLYDINTIAGFLVNAAEKNPHVKLRFAEMPYCEGGKESAPEEGEENIDLSYLTEEYRYRASTTIKNKLTVSEIMEAEDGVAKPFTTRGDGTEASVGTAYHLVMQKINFANSDPEYIKTFVEELVKTGELEEEIAEKIDVFVVSKLLQSDIIRLAMKNTCYREQPFMSVMDGEGGYSLIQGVIDLLIEEDDGFSVVDFKASGLTKERLKQKYARQLELYSEAVERIFGKKVKRRVLFNIIKNYSVEV